MLADFDEEEEKLKITYKEAKEKRKEEVKDSIPSKPKPDSAYLQLKKTKEALIKQKQYDKACIIEQKIKKLEKVKQDVWEGAKNEKISVEIERIQKKCKRDYDNFLEKKNLAIFEFERNKTKELDQLLKRYKNTASDLVLSQKTLKSRLLHTETVVNKSLKRKPSNPASCTKIEKDDKVEDAGDSPQDIPKDYAENKDDLSASIVD